MSIFSDLKPITKWPRNVFDTSHSETFHTKLGTITPCFVKHTIPQGKYKIDMSDIVRVSEQVTANFVSLSQNFEFFFVPYSQLWKPFNKFLYQRGEKTRSYSVTYSSNETYPQYVPGFDLKAVFNKIFESIVSYRSYISLIENCKADNADVPDWLRRFAAEEEIAGASAWFDRRFVDVHGRYCGYDQLRVLDMLGYGNVWPLFKYALGSWNPASNIEEQTFKTTVATQKTQWWSRIDAYFETVYPNCFALMAYWKIFNDVYRNRQYDEQNYAYIFNCDWFAGNNVSAYSEQFILKMCKPYYRMYKKDLYTGLYPTPQFGDVAVVSSNPINSQVLLSSSSTSSVDVGIFSQNLVGKDVNGSTTSQFWNIHGNSSNPFTTKVSALAIRQSLALQKYKETILRAGNRESDLQKSMFGVSSRYIDNDYVEILGSFASALQMNPVAATATTSGDVSSNLGELGAYSVGSIGLGNNREIEFEAYDYGIIIGVCYVMPETKYENFGFDMQNTKSQTGDYYNPFYQNLGLAPVYRAHLNQFFVGNDYVMGYLARYYEYKTAISKVHGEFFGSNPVVPYDPDLTSHDDGDYERYAASSFGAFSQFVAPRDIREMDSGTLQMLYVAPEDADRIFKVSDKPDFAYDHFKFEVSFQCKDVLPMSTLGLPI